MPKENFAARITSPKKMEIEEIPMPSINDGQCLIELEKWSVCGSDIRHAYGPVHSEEEYPMRHGGACHECAGRIIESKSDKFKVGQRVIVLPGADGPGGLVGYYPGDEDRMALVPDDGDLGEWVLCQPSGTVLYSCQQMGTILGKDVVIMGQGSIGLSFTAITSRAGARRVIVVDPQDYRLKWGKKFGWWLRRSRLCMLHHEPLLGLVRAGLRERRSTAKTAESTQRILEQEFPGRDFS